MRTKWGQPRSMAGPSVQLVYTYALVLLSFMATLGMQAFRCMRVWTPLERHYLPAYLCSKVVGVVRDNGEYTLLQVVTRKGSRLARGSDVMPAITQSEENSLALTAEALKHGALRLEFHRARYNNAEMHTYLGNLIYQNQTLMDLVRPALWGGLVLFLVGMLPATYLDHKRPIALRYHRRWRSPELMPVAQFDHRHRSGGTHFVNEHRTTLDRLLGRNKKLHAPVSKHNPPVLVMAEPSPQEPLKIAAAAGAHSALQPSSTRQKPAPQKQTPSQGQPIEHNVQPPTRRFFE